jgi:sulfur-oxidizing protein SoxZ
MSNDPGKIRAKAKDGGIAVRALIRHPMETGSRKHPATDEPIPRHYIQALVCEHNGAPVLGMDWGWGVSANPYVAFQIASGAAGDRVTLRWHDNRGETGELSTTVV